MTELIVRALVLLALAAALPFAAGLVFTFAAFGAFVAFCARFNGRRSAADITGDNMYGAFAEKETDNVDSADCDDAITGAITPRGISPLYDDETTEEREVKCESARTTADDVMRLIDETENAERLSAANRAIACARVKNRAR